MPTASRISFDVIFLKTPIILYFFPKGYERVGRELSAQDKVKWAESWCFLDHMVDLRTKEGLSLLNNYLGGVRRKESLSSMLAGWLRRKLDFDDDEG